MLDPDSATLLPSGATVIDYGIDFPAGWGAVHFEGRGEIWGATDLSTIFFLPYREAMAVYYAFGGPLEEPMAELWRFDVVGQRPPAVRLVARWSYLDSERLDCPDALPGPLGMLFEQLEIDVV